MKRFLASSLIIGVSTFGLVGCDEKSKVEDVKTIKTPDGSEKVKTTVEDTKSGSAKETAPTTTPETPK
jgi:hypothetical protein